MSARAFFREHSDFGEVVTLISENSTSSIEACIAPKYGSNLFSLKIDGHEVINCNTSGLTKRDTSGTSDYTATPVLYPTPNRISNNGKDREYVFDGKTYSFKDVLSPAGNASLVHGIVRDEAFAGQIVSSGGDTAVAETSVEISPSSRYYSCYPFPSRLTLTWTISDQGLSLKWRVENTGESRLGFGFALHPEFITGQNDVWVAVPARSVMEMDGELVSTGRKLDLEQVMYKMLSLTKEKPVSQLDLDHVYTDKIPNSAPHLTYRNLGITISQESDCDSVVVYTGNKTLSMCLEPQWGKTNALNLFAQGFPEDIHGLKLLNPGEQATGSVLFRVTRQ